MKFTLYVFTVLICIIWLGIATAGATANFVLSQSYPMPIFWLVNGGFILLLSWAFNGMIKNLHK